MDSECVEAEAIDSVRGATTVMRLHRTHSWAEPAAGLTAASGQLQRGPMVSCCGGSPRVRPIRRLRRSRAARDAGKVTRRSLEMVNEPSIMLTESEPCTTNFVAHRAGERRSLNSWRRRLCERLQSRDDESALAASAVVRTHGSFPADRRFRSIFAEERWVRPFGRCAAFECREVGPLSHPIEALCGAARATGPLTASAASRIQHCRLRIPAACLDWLRIVVTRTSSGSFSSQGRRCVAAGLPRRDYRRIIAESRVFGRQLALRQATI